MARRRDWRQMPGTRVTRYNDKTVHREREYGFYWYSGLWHIARPILVVICALIIVAGIVVSGIQYVNNAFFSAVEPENVDIIDFTIPSGTSVTGIGEMLYEQNLIKNKGVFKYIVQLRGLTSKIQHGSYPLSRGMDIFQIVDAISAGSASNERTITVIPGWTVEDIAEYLKRQGAISDEKEFLTLANDIDRFRNDYYCLQDASKNPASENRKYQLEGYLAPDTYRIYMNATVEDIIRTLLKQTETVEDVVFNTTPASEVLYNEVGEIITDDDEDSEDDGEEIEFVSTLSRDETIILASIIEKEAGKRSDYAKVSAVFHNRLERNMALESDATVAYPDRINRMVLTSDELEKDTPYNTYIKTGLPAGAICNPSKAAMQAALYPDTEYIYDGYLYFCATEPGTGELVFARTREEHLANVAKYQQLWRQADIEKASQVQ